MQKKIIALAVAGLSTAAFAQTNVTIYGVADVSAQGTNVSQHVATTSNIQGNVFTLKNNSSLLGFKGTEALGNGVNALFQMESNIGLTGQATGTGVSAGTTSAAGWGQLRDSYVGASTKYGTVLGGFLSTPYRSALNSFDVMPGATGDGRIENSMGRLQYSAGSGGVTGAATAGSALASSIRATAIAYAMPTMYGFNGAIAYTGSNNTMNNQAYGSAPNLRSGLSFNLGWDGYGVGIKGAFSQFGYDNSTGAGAPSIQGYTSYLLGAQYTGVPGLKLATVYGRNTIGTNANGASTAAAQKGSNNQIWVGASYRFGNNEPRLSYQNTSNVSGMNDPTSTNLYASQTGNKQWTANWGYYLSKRTQVYGIVSVIGNNANSTLNMGSGGTSVTLSGGQNVTTYGMGMRTNF